MEKGDIVECPVCGVEEEWDGESCIRCARCYLDEKGCFETGGCGLCPCERKDDGG